MKTLLSSLSLLMVVLVSSINSSSITAEQLLKVLKRIKLERTNFKDLITAKSSNILGNKKVLACPRPQTFFHTERTEPECTSDRSCRRSELCCPWFDKKHCLKGIDTKPRDGVCPKITQLNDMCVADMIGCRYDNECLGEDEKCCFNRNCDKHECLSIRQNIACPVPETQPVVAVARKEKRCIKDLHCEHSEKCCDWFSSLHCFKGIDTIPRPGFCPMTVPVSLAECKADFHSCYHDSECPGVQEKCCYNQGCNYFECMDINADFACPSANLDSYLENKGDVCEHNVDCGGFTSLCCDLHGTKHCITGIHVPPKHGECPAVSEQSLNCQAEGSVSECEYDSQCRGEKKCCDSSCGHKKCLELPPTPSVESEEGLDVQKKDILEKIIKELDF